MYTHLWLKMREEISAYNFKMKLLLSYNECLVSTKHATGFATKLPAGGHAKLLH